MSRRQWSVEEKILILQTADTEGVAATCRNHGISGASFYKWRNAYETSGKDGLKPHRRGPHFDPELKRLEKENGQLKKLLAEKELAIQIKEDLLKKTLQRRMTR